MADVKDITLNRLIEEFQSLALANKFVSSFFYGDFADIIASNKIIHSAVLLNTANGTIDENYITFQLEIAAMDKVFNDKTNQTEVESDAVQILQDIFSVVTYSKRWQSFSVFRGASPIRKFIQKGEDMATGWSMTLTLNIKRSNGICNIPVEDYDYEGDYTPSCAGVRIYEDGILVEVVPSGDRYDYTTGGGGTASQTFNGTSVTDQDSGTTKVITVKNSGSNNVGTKVSDTALILSITIADVSETFNTVPVSGIKAEGTKNIVAVNTALSPVGSVIVDTETDLSIVVSDSIVNVKNSAGTIIHSKTVPAEATDDQIISDSPISINAIPVANVLAEESLNIDVVDSASNPTGNWNGTAWEIDNSTVNVNGNQIASVVPASILNLNVHDSASADVGTINGSTVDIDDSTVLVKDSSGTTLHIVSVKAENTANQTVADSTISNSDDSYNSTVKAEGNKELPDISVTINGANQGNFPSVKNISINASNIIYIRPANSGYGTTSYLTGDEGYNETNYPAPAAPAFGIPAFLDSTDPKKLLNNNAFGHKQRFTGINGGYYDYATLQYKLADGTVSDQATTFGTVAANTSYLIDHHTGLGWKWNIQGSTIWSTQVTNILGLTHASYSDYFLPSRTQYRSLFATYNLSLGLSSVIPFNSNGSLKTSTPSFGTEATSHHQLTSAASLGTRTDASADAAYACRWHY